MTVQNTYQERLDPGRAGAIVNTEHHNAVSRTAEDAAGLAFGLPVARGANDNGCKLRAAGEDVLGISVRERSLDANGDGNSVTQYESARVMTEGLIWVDVPVSVAAGDDVYMVDADGSWHNAASAGRTQLANAKFDSSTSGAGVAKLRFGSQQG